MSIGRIANAHNGKVESSGRMHYLPGLDGLRALAVLAVLFYHAGLSWARGGFLGVEVFFVLSGYLITALLQAEWEQSGRIDLKAFWVRRARRLLPALFLLLVATLTFAVIFLPSEVADLRADTLAAAGYATNWYLILAQKSYFQSVGRPSLLQHLWSLAVEEQFYLLWPLLFLGLLRIPRRLAPLGVIAGAVISATLMAGGYRQEVDPSRIYYGTDTRAAGLLIGAALALLWRPSRSTSDSSRLKRALFDGAGLIAFATLIGFCVFLDESNPLLYQGGFALVALATIAVIAIAVHPAPRLGRSLLGQEPLRWIGMRSYGIYLWHWPIFMVTRPQLDVALDGIPLLALRFAATFAAAELSYRLIETPIRAGALGRAWQAWWNSPRRFDLRWAGTVGALAGFAVLLGIAVAGAEPPPPPSYLAVDRVDTLLASQPESSSDVSASLSLPSGLSGVGESSNAQLDPQPEQAPIPPSLAVPEPNAAPLDPTAAQNMTDPAPELAESLFAAARNSSMLEAHLPVKASAPPALPAIAPEPPVTTTTPGRVVAIGDSVMVGAAPELDRAIPGIEIDAKQGRLPTQATAILRDLRDKDQLGRVVIIHIGTNTPFTSSQFEDMLTVLDQVPRVILVTIKVPRPWEKATNDLFAAAPKQHPNVVLADWNASCADHPELFWPDGIHVRPEGARLYANLIAAFVRDAR